MLLESTVIGMPTAKKMAATAKNSTMVLLRVGIGSQAFSICCLKDSTLLFSVNELLLFFSALEVCLYIYITPIYNNPFSKLEWSTLADQIVINMLNTQKKTIQGIYFSVIERTKLKLDSNADLVGWLVEW